MIPISNLYHKDVDVQVTATKIDATSVWWTFPAKFRIPHDKDVGMFPISFFPKWQANARATLILKIVSANTSQSLHYDLSGIGMEPLSEGHVFLKCELKKEKTHSLIVTNTNPKKLVTYKVESDIPNFYGPETIKVSPKEREKYTFKVRPTLSGTYIG